MASTGDWLRHREGRSEVDSAELFFDLVFVFAVTQLSHSLLADRTPLAALQTVLLFFGVWWLWVNTAWVTNWLDPKQTPVRLLLFALMAAGLVVSMALPRAFAERGLAFSVAYVAMQLGRSLFMLAALRGRNAANHRSFVRITLWLCVSGLFWIAGGLTGEMVRLGFWLAATAVEMSGPALFFRVPGLGRSTVADWDVDGSHMAERFGLFIIIALGESILITGAAVAGQPWTVASLSGFAGALAGAIAMWWIYFNIGARRAEHRIAHAAEPGALARLAYTYLHIPIVGGIIASAAANELVIAHPDGHVGPAVAALLLGGPALYLAGVCAFKWVTAGWPPLSHLTGMGALVAAAVLAAVLTPLELGLLVAAIMMVVGIWETRSLRLWAAADAAPAAAEAPAIVPPQEGED